MDERRTTIRELEERKSSDTQARDHLLEGLGKALIQRIGTEEPFKEKTPPAEGEETPGIVLGEYRLLQRELEESWEIIKSLEADIQKLKDLEEEISAKEKEYSGLEKELEQVYVVLGRALLSDSEFDSIAGSAKHQEELLLEKIHDQERRLDELEERQGGILAWLGKNAQMAVSKALLLKNRSSLQRLYYNTGEKYLNLDPGKDLDTEAAEAFENAHDLKTNMKALAHDLTVLKAERRKITDHFGQEGAPSRRILALEKHIVNVKGEFPKIHLRFGVLAAAAVGKKGEGKKTGWKKTLFALLEEDDLDVLKKAEQYAKQIAAAELEIKRLNAAINIDKQKGEIDKLNKAIDGQKQKIAFAEEAIDGFKKQIAQSEKAIQELEEFLRQTK